MSDDSPTIFGGRYELHRRLARGGMADVFLARDQLLGRPVAVKVLFPEFAADPKFVERFRREAQAAANLNHPNIVSIYDWGEELGTYYIVMEYVEGQSLAQILRRDGKLSAEQVTRVALDVSAALGFAHDGGVVHRDVKPGNVLVSPKGEMKVADFGIATAMTSTVESSLTQTGAVMGTATYFSPEQAQGHKVDHRSDLYSLGVVMYEMLVGHPPFTGETPVSIAYKHVQEPVPPVSDQGTDVPPALAAICMKLLSKNPDNRYPDAGALRADLDRFRQGQAMAQVTAGAVPGPASLGQTSVLPAQQRARRTPVSYTPPPRRRGGLMFIGLLTLLLILGGFLILAREFLSPTNDVVTEPVADPQEVIVAPVAGRGETDGRNTLEGQNLVVERRAVADDSVAAGLIITTEPPANTKLSTGSTVVIVVSTGRNAAVVPSVLTMTENAALQTLADAGFKVSIRRVPSNIAPEGEVVSQDPPNPNLLTLGETVTIDVSGGVEQIPVPDVAGSELDQARSLLESEGFVIDSNFQFVVDDEVPRGAVVGTEPPEGSPVAPGSTLTIVLSDGPEFLVMPDFIGYPRDLARQELEAMGLVPRELAQIVTDQALVGFVTNTVPPANAEVAPGQQVDVYIGVGTAVPTPIGGIGQEQPDPGEDGQGADEPLDNIFEDQPDPSG